MPDEPLATLIRRCRVCGCTDDEACRGGCWWVADPEGGDLCSACEPSKDEEAAA